MHPPKTRGAHCVQAVLAANEASTLAALMDSNSDVGDRPDTRPASGWSALLTQIGVLLLNKLHLSIGNVHVRFVVCILVHQVINTGRLTG